MSKNPVLASHAKEWFRRVRTNSQLPSAAMMRILVADDDERLAELVRKYLENAGFAVLVAHDGRTALDLARGRKPDLVVLDLQMPEVDGWDVCRILRAESDVPIIMLTARATESDMLLGLDLGADDYITKPFSPKEVVARVRTVLRRSGNSAAVAPQMWSIGKLEVDAHRHEARLEGQDLGVTPREFAVLQVLAANPGKAFSRSQLVSGAFGFDYDGMERTVDAHVRSLRKKLGDDSADPTYIETVYGVGYRMIDR